MRTHYVFLITAVILTFTSVITARADDSAPRFMSMDSVPGHRHGMALQKPSHFFALNGRKISMGQRHQMQMSAPVKPAIASVATQARSTQTKQADTTPAPLPRQMAKSSTAQTMTEENARQLLSIFPTVE